MKHSISRQEVDTQLYRLQLMHHLCSRQKNWGYPNWKYNFRGETLLRTTFSLMYDTHLQNFLSAQTLSLSNCADPVFCLNAQAEQLKQPVFFCL